MRPSIIIAVIFTLFQCLDCRNFSPLSRLGFFDIELLIHAAEDKKGNVMVSPASIKTTLAMLLEGAQGKTASEIKTALRVSPEQDDFREEIKIFLKTFEVNSTVVSIQNANALFVSKKLKLKKEYETLARRFYSSEINGLNFNDAKSSADTVNEWVDKKTHGLIPTIVDEDQITPSTDMMVTNALYFKAPWKHGFNSKATTIDCFFNKGVCIKVAMMSLEAELNYAYVEDLRSHALELPYQDDRYSMLLIVPQDRDAGLSMIRDLPYIGIPDISKKMDSVDVVLSMPRFDIEYSEDMTDPLRKMHVTTLFSQAANLSGIFGNGEFAHVNSIFHSVHMKVDESGTVAAAASSSVVVPLINDEIQLRIDRPFLFFIRDNKQGVILFEGKVEEPKLPLDPNSDKVPDKLQLPQQPIIQLSGTRSLKPQASGPTNLEQTQSAMNGTSSILTDDKNISPQSNLKQRDHVHRIKPGNKPSPGHHDPSQTDVSSIKPTISHTEPTSTELFQRQGGFFSTFGKRVRDYICPYCYN